MNEIEISVAGNVVDKPELAFTDQQVPVARFRLASTPWWRDRDGTVRQGETSFFDVSCWRALALNVEASLLKGQGVVVRGRVRVREWKTDERTGRAVQIDATSVGHDLAFGTSSFERVRRSDKVDRPGEADADALAARLEDQAVDDEVRTPLAIAG